MPDLKNIKSKLFPLYLHATEGMFDSFADLKEADISTENFSFYTSVASVFSSKIEGEDIEIDSYIKHKKLGIAFQPDYTRKIDDLYNAYKFAASNFLDKKNLLHAHKMLTTNILQPHLQGVYRTSNMYVLANDGKIEYVATSASKVETEMQDFFVQMKELLEQEQNIAETFFYAALLHLLFVKNSSHE